MSDDRIKVNVRIKSTGNTGYLRMHIAELRAKGIERTLLYYDLPHGASTARQIDLAELEEIA